MSYELPFGRGRRLLNRGGVANHAPRRMGAHLDAGRSNPDSRFTVNFSNSPNRYLPGESRPNLLTSVEDAHGEELGYRRQPASPPTPRTRI